MKCSDCGIKLTVEEMRNRSDYPMCRNCEFIAEMENEHSDGHHIDEFNILCRDCMVEISPVYVWVITENPILNSIFEGRKFAQFPINTNSRILAAI